MVYGVELSVLKIKSGWKNNNDMRRKMVHYFDTFDVQKSKNKYSFVITEPFLWVHYTFPKNEIKSFDALVTRSLKRWERISENKYVLGDLSFSIDMAKPLDDFMTFPKNYLYRSYTLSKKDYQLNADIEHEPWDVLKTGIRPIMKRGNPLMTTKIKDIQKYFPAHFELGCGPSIEAGIPPLHFLHEVFGISDPKTGMFILDLAKDKLIPFILTDPKSFYLQSSLPYRKALISPATKFYRTMSILKDKNLLIEPIITNNFDGFSSLMGLKEQYVRRYKESEIMPKLDIDPRAKSLIVVGAHADRRHT